MYEMRDLQLSDMSFWEIVLKVADGPVKVTIDALLDTAEKRSLII